MRRALPLSLAILAPVLAHAEAPPDAVALFEQGIKDMQAGNLEAGCRELASSLSRYEDSGTKGALATCYTRQGKVTSAWNLWKDLADTATRPDDRSDAATHAKQLEPRLPHFVVALATPAVPGLVVTVNGVVADPSLGVALPVDPGPVVAAAHAPDHGDWSQTYMASEGRTLAIEVPALPAVPRPVSAPVAIGASLPRPSLEPGPARHARHLLGASIGGVGALALVGGAVFGAKASSAWSDAKSECGGDGASVTHCTPAGLPLAQHSVSDARSAALVSTIGFGLGGALVVTGALLYLTAPPAGEHLPGTALRVVPTASPTAAGLVVTGRW